MPSVSIWRGLISAPHTIIVINAERCYEQTVDGSDTSDSRNHMPKLLQNADPAVTVAEIKSSQTVDTIDSASTDNSNTCEKLADPVGQLAVPFRNGADHVTRYVPALLCSSKLPEPQAENAAQGIVAHMNTTTEYILKASAWVLFHFS